MPHFTRDEWINMDPAEYARHTVPQGFDPRVTCACGEKSALYEMFPSCRDCGAYVCEDCEAADSRQEHDHDRGVYIDVRCRACADPEPHIYDAQDALDDAADWAYDRQQEDN